MDFRLSKEQEMLCDAVYKFTQKEWEPRTVEIDESNRFPMWLWQRFRDMGWCGLMIPKEYGGQGLTLLDTCLALEAAARAGGDIGACLAWAVHLSIGTIPLLICGNEEQKKKYLPKMASGEWQSCFLLTEPNVGSDAAGVETTAVREGDYYIINGTKTFITNAPTADVGMIMASTDLSKGAKGLTAFMVDMKAPGVTVGEPFNKIGPRGSEQAEVHFDNVKVHVSDRILNEGDGFIQVGVKNLEYERSCLTSIWTGAMAYNIDLCIKYAKERKQFGHPIIQFGQIRDKIAQMQIEYDICKMLMCRACAAKDLGLDAPLEATEFKVYVGQAAVRCGVESIQILGGYGLIKEYKVERLLRDAKLSQLGAGTEEVLKEVIARVITKTRSLTM